MEVLDPTTGLKFGILHGGRIYKVEEWAEKCKTPEASFRRVLSKLRKQYALVVQRMSQHGYSIAIIDSYKPSKAFTQSTIDKYPWLLKSKQPKGPRLPKSKRPERPRLLRNEQAGCQDISNLAQDVSNLPQDLSNLNDSKNAQVLVKCPYKACATTSGQWCLAQKVGLSALGAGMS